MGGKSCFDSRRDYDQTKPFCRALVTLDIAPIHAHTPQDKGRGERANRTLQSDLFKEMRLQGRRAMTQANISLLSFMANYNHRLVIPAAEPTDAH